MKERQKGDIGERERKKNVCVIHDGNSNSN